jgi:hypothetical protein
MFIYLGLGYRLTLQRPVKRGHSVSPHTDFGYFWGFLGYRGVNWGPKIMVRASNES